MARVRTFSGKELVQLLQQHGFGVVRRRGSQRGAAETRRSVDGHRSCARSQRGEGGHPALDHSAVSLATQRVRILTDHACLGRPSRYDQVVLQLVLHVGQVVLGPVASTRSPHPEPGEPPQLPRSTRVTIGAIPPRKPGAAGSRSEPRTLRGLGRPRIINREREKGFEPSTSTLAIAQGPVSSRY